MKKFLKKVKSFIKRNAYALSISACVLLAVTLISVTAISASNPQSGEVVAPVPDVPVNSTETIIFVNPVENATIIKEYAENHLVEDKTSGYWQTHQAIDYLAEVGAKVFAVYNGQVEKIEQSMMDGTVITIKHTDGLKTVYRCLSEDVLVSEGEQVVSGQQIGSVCENLLEKADGCHLHFELYKNDELIDPTPYFAESNK